MYLTRSSSWLMVDLVRRVVGGNLVGLNHMSEVVNLFKYVILVSKDIFGIIADLVHLVLRPVDPIG